MNVLSAPEAWNSAHRPIRYELGFFYRDGIITDGSIGLRITTTSDLPITVRVDDLIRIDGGTYDGTHKVLTVISQGHFIVEGTFTVTDLQPVANLFVPSFELYKGHTSSDPYPVQLPFELIATFKPEFDPDFEVSVDLSGYIISAFLIAPPSNQGIDFSMFNKFRIHMVYAGRGGASGGTMTIKPNPFNVLNSSIKTSVLNTNYLNTDAYLSPSFPVPYLFTCGKTILSKLFTEFVENFTFFPNIPDDCDFNADFNPDYLIC